MDSTPGLYKNVLVLDFKSLYPSIIRSFNIDPMGLIEGLKSPDKSIEGFDGAYFSRDKHFLPDIINDLWLERDIAKKDKNAALSQAISSELDPISSVPSPLLHCIVPTDPLIQHVEHLASNSHAI